MAKIKVFKLAEELNIQSKEILAYLQGEGIEAKVAQSSIGEEAAALVKKRFGGAGRVKEEGASLKAEAAKEAGEAKAVPREAAAKEGLLTQAAQAKGEAKQTGAAPKEGVRAQAAPEDGAAGEGAPKTASQGPAREGKPGNKAREAAAPAQEKKDGKKPKQGQDGAGEASAGKRAQASPRKKKNIIFVSNPQHSKMSGKQRSPVNNQGGRGRQGQEGNRPAPPVKPIQLGPNQMINKSTGKVMEMLPPRKPVQEPAPVPAPAPAPAPAPEPVREAKEQKPFREGSVNRPAQDSRQGDRPQNRGGQHEERRGQGGGFNRQGRPAQDSRQGDRPQNRGGQHEERRGQGGGFNRQGGERQGRPGQGGERQGRPGQGERQGFGGGRGGFSGGGSAQGSGRGFGGGDRPQGRNAGQDNRFAGKKEGKGFAADAPSMQSEKHRDDQRRQNAARDKRSRKDYEAKEQEIKKKNRAGRFIKPEVKPPEPEEKIKVIILPETLTIKELAEKMKQPATAIIKKLFLQGKVVTLNQEIAFEDAENIAIEYEIMCEQEVKVDVIEELLKEEEDAADTLEERAPVICVMGHVDHGKTSLLDVIRKTNVTDREAGGITQHIGAYSVKANGRKITFLDTPGHEAFTAMRMRGANATDIAILVVAADDGVMPQTIEAINHAKAAGIEILVAVNKMDKPDANMDRVKQELSEHGLIPEDWGGKTVFAPVSAKTGRGIPELLEMILLTADILELKANPARKGRGLVIEAQLDKGRGPVATVLVQKGTLRVGDFISAGASHGKVRAMIDDKGRRVKEAGPSTPVEILGLSDIPNAGEVFLAHDSDKTAKSYAETFVARHKERKLEEIKSKMSLDDLFNQIQEGNLKELNLIVKADVQGSVEAVKQSLLKLSNEEVVVKCIHGGVGAINESDVTLAATSSAIIIGFNVRPDVTAKATAEREGVDIRLYTVIYQAIGDIEAAMKGMLDPIFEEKVIGHAEVRQIFRASQIGNIAGSYVLDGVFQRNCKVRITREGEQIYEGSLASLKRFKDDVKEVKAGFECGLVFEGFDQIQELDIAEAYIMVEVPR